MSNHNPWGENNPEPPRRGFWRGFSGLLIILAILLGGAVALYFLAQSFPEALSSQGDQVSLVYFLALGAVLVLSSLGARRLRGTDFARYLRYAVFWAAIFVVLAGGYSYKAELNAFGQRIMSNLLPGYGGGTGPDEVTYSRAEDGHFYIGAEAENTRIRFLVDTGATDVVLSPRDAQRIGFDLSKVRFDRTFQTANGTVRGARVLLRDLWIGDRRLQNLAVSINEAPMRESLLGMAFLDQLESFEVRGDHLHLRWSPKP